MANKKYTKEFKLDAVRLALTSDKSQAQVARDLGLRDNVLYNWVSKYRGEVLGSAHGMTPEQEMAALRKENAQLRQETDILKKAAAYFAKYHA